MNKLYVGILLKFFSVGVIATAIHAVTYAVAIQLFEIHAQTANLFGYLLAVSFSYLLQMRWTFAHRSVSPGIKSLSKFMSSSLFTFIFNAVFVYCVENVLLLNSLYGLFGIIFIAPIITFVLLNFWVFTPNETNDKI